MWTSGGDFYSYRCSSLNTVSTHWDEAEYFCGIFETMSVDVLVMIQRVDSAWWFGKG